MIIKLKEEKAKTGQDINFGKTDYITKKIWYNGISESTRKCEIIGIRKFI